MPNGHPGILSQLPPVVRGLLLLNIALYLTDLLFFDHLIRYHARFSIPTAIGELKIWEFITFQFMHGSVGHLLMNSIGLYFFGPVMERVWGSVRFLCYYLACGVGAALFFTLLAQMNVLPEGNRDAALVGASGGIYGMIAAVAVLAPHSHVQLLIPPIVLTMRQFALGVIGIAVAVVVFRWGNNVGGEAGHLGGAFVGYVLAKRGAAFTFGSRKTSRGNYVPKIRPRTVVDLQADDEVDRILDKISREGFQSLSDEERDLLHRAAKQDQD